MEKSKKNLKRQNNKKLSSSNAKLRKTNKAAHPAQDTESIDYYESGSNDYDNSNSDNYEDDSNDHDQEDVFANVDGIVKEESYSDDEDNESTVIKQVYVESHQPAPKSTPKPNDNDILKHIMIKLDRISSTNEHNFRLISAQNNEIIKQQISINNNLKMLEKRIQRIETKLQCDVKIDDFTIDVINNVDEFKQFLSSVQNDQEYSGKCTVYLHKHCPKGSSKHTHYGVIKGIIDRLFSPIFKNNCGWASEKNKKNSDNPQTTKSNRVLLSEHYAFQKLILDVLNFNSTETFTTDHVADGIKEYYKRFPRKVIDSETEGGSMSSISEELERRHEQYSLQLQLDHQNETAEERQIRREADASRLRRMRETEEQRQRRLAIERNRQKTRRRNETEEEHQMRLERERIRQAQKRNCESEEKRQKRLEKQRIRQQRSRGKWVEDENQIKLEEYVIEEVKMENYENYLM
ncbi:histone-lysine N-methyltransferase, H3 lysine-79 specific-like [Chironomus tepperi]|uniref:histone-lysine N-methyltransferase, H3 lysine-79 specific-like n=1 Tax=Chironomus tepperi TaxID=113505 RepID=UPI00391F59BE